MSRSPRVEAPSACEMVRHLRSPGPPGRGEQTSTPLPTLLSTSAPDPAALPLRCSRCRWDAHLGSHDTPAAGPPQAPALLAGQGAWGGEASPTYPWATADGPKGAEGTVWRERKSRCYAGCSHPDPFCSRRRGPGEAWTVSVPLHLPQKFLSLRLQSDHSDKHAVLSNRDAHFLLRLFCRRFFLRNLSSGLGLAFQRRECFSPGTESGSPGPTKSPCPWSGLATELCSSLL